MHIANPTYDVVFKFMMEDEQVAKSFLSAIIEENVVELEFTAQERTLRRPKKQAKEGKPEENKLEEGKPEENKPEESKLEENKPEESKSEENKQEEVKPEEGKPEEEEEENEDEYAGESFFTVCRFDFSAKIALPNGGFKVVLIELQKAKLSSDIMRFRRYLGVHYQDSTKKASQIYCIFLLGYDIGISGRPIIQVDTTIKDGTTKENLTETNDFIQSLHHRSWIVQIDQLKQRRRNDVEILLSVFDQENRTRNHHIMNIDENDFPETYHPLIRRLRMASESEDIQIEMEMEDDYMQDLLDKERTIVQQKQEIKEKDKALKEHRQALKEHRQALKEKDKALEEKDKALEEKDKEFEKLKRQLLEIRRRQ
jgi:hypothetical protein